MSEVDWVELWRELSFRFRWSDSDRVEGHLDRWSERAGNFDTEVKGESKDILHEFVLHKLTPESTVLDIGAGTGRWTIPLARVARRVTAIDPSPAMLAILRQKADAAGLTNIQIVEATWEEVAVEPHEVALCSHAMYASPDLIGFVRKMECSARQRCYLVMRVPSPQDVIAELARLLYGHSYDSPSFIVGYNALHSAGIYANVLMDPEGRHRTDHSLEEALLRAKRHLGLIDSSEYDEMIRNLLTQRLVQKDGLYHWPDSRRSALLWWDSGSEICS